MQLDYQEFYKLVSDLISEKKTKTLFGNIDGNRSLIIAIQDGEITSLACGAQFGISVIPLIRQMKSGTFSVEDALTHLQSAFESDDLPSTPGIMASLKPSADQGALKSQPSSVDPGVAAGTEILEQILCEMLSEYIGPVASIVCSDEIEAAGGLSNEPQITQVINNLAEEIGDPEKARRFIAGARSQLGSVS